MNKAEKLLRRMSEALDDFGPDEDIGIFGSGMWRPIATVEEVRKAAKEYMLIRLTHTTQKPY